MPRKVRDSNLETRTARGRLKVAHKPYFRLIEPGLHLGYRKLAGGPGTWLVRRYSGAGKYVAENLRTDEGAIVTADDYSDADGRAILTFGQAQERAKARQSAPLTGDLPTVGTVVEAYIAARDEREASRRGRPFRSDAHRLRRYVTGRAPRGKQEAVAPAELARVRLDRLRDEDLSEWRASLPKAMSTAAKQRVTSDLKAALNLAYAQHRKKLDPSFVVTVKHALKAAEGGEPESPARDNQILTDAQITALLRAAQEIDAEQGWEGDLYRMAVVLAATGARFSQVARMRVADCLAVERRLLVPVSRKGKGKTGSVRVAVSEDTIRALQPAMVGRSEAPLFERWRHQQVKGNKWERVGRGAWKLASEFSRPWGLIAERAKLPEIIPYALRHSSIVRGLRQHLPVGLVAKMHDTSTKIIERHYARYIIDALDELAARSVVSLVPSEI